VLLSIVTILPCGESAAEPPGAQPAAYERSAANTAPRSVQFDRREPQVGDQLEQSLAVELQLNTMARQGSEVVEQAKTRLRRRQRRVVTTTHVIDGKTVAVLVRYAEAAKMIAAGPRAAELGEEKMTSQPVDGKAYRCRRDGDSLLITDEAGKIPPLDEYEIVALNMESLGRPNPLADYLAGRTLTVGQQLALPHDVAEKLLGLGGELGEVTRFDLTLTEVKPIDGAVCAVFQASIEAASIDSSQMRLAVEGPLAIQADTCRAVQAYLTGPIGMSETRGSLTATYQMTGTGKMTVQIASRYSDVAR
jgi:hypothetical protein